MASSGAIPTAGLLEPKWTTAPTVISSRPVQSANDSDRNVELAGGDFSQTFSARYLKLTGAATLGTPATGYGYVDETIPELLIFESTSGHNESLSTNDGRTGAVAKRIKCFHGGQGDMIAYNAEIQIYAQGQAGATHFLANPAAGFLGGDIGPIFPHCYLQGIGDINFVDNGVDTACAGLTFNFTRTVATAGLGEVWMGIRLQGSAGQTQPIDAALSLGGSLKTKIGVDLSQAQYDANNAAITLAQNQRIYLKATSTAIGGINWFGNTPGTEYLDYSSTLGGVEVGSKGATAFLVTAAASPVNYLTTQAAATGGSVQLAAIGGDVNVGLLIATKGNGAYNFRAGGTGGATQFFINSQTGAVNFVSVTAATAGNEPQIAVGGSDTNINMQLAPKGTGVLDINPCPTTTVAPGAGGAGALPATPAGYFSISINNTLRKVAYY